MKEVIIQEQLMNTLAPSIRIWVKERKPKSAIEAGQLADDYLEARKQSTKENQPDRPNLTSTSVKADDSQQDKEDS